MLRIVIRLVIMASVVCFAVAGEAATTGKSVSEAMSFYDAIEIAVGTYVATGIGPMQKRVEEIERVLKAVVKAVAPRLAEEKA